MAKLQLDLSEAVKDEKGGDQPTVEEVSENETLRKMAVGLPSHGRAEAQALKNAPRTQFSFTNFPVPIKEAFADEAKKRGMGKKEFLFHCLRAGGVDIPPYDEIDGRRR